MSRLHYLFLFAYLFFAGCSSSSIITLWKSANPRTVHFNKILVLSVEKTGSDSIRATRENALIHDLNSIGYTAVSSIAEFGAHGLTGLGEEAAYLKLCDNGIDAVLTIALIDHDRNAHPEPGNKKYTSAYYYNRIWSYIKNGTLKTGNSEYLWETILFDLVLLQPHFVGQTKPFFLNDEKYNSTELSQIIIHKMRKEKIIFKTTTGN